MRLFKLAAISACTCLALYLQVIYVTTESNFAAEEVFERTPLYPQPWAQVLSCLLVPFLALVGCACLAYPRPGTLGKHLAVAGMIAITPSLLAFELLYFFTSLPSTVSGYLQPLSHATTPTFLVFLVSWCTAFLILRHDADPLPDPKRSQRPQS